MIEKFWITNLDILLAFKVSEWLVLCCWRKWCGRKVRVIRENQRKCSVYTTLTDKINFSILHSPFSLSWWQFIFQCCIQNFMNFVIFRIWIFYSDIKLCMSGFILWNCFRFLSNYNHYSFILILITIVKIFHWFLVSPILQHSHLFQWISLVFKARTFQISSFMTFLFKTWPFI